MNKLLLSHEAISIAVRDFLKFVIFLGVKIVLTNTILKLFIKSIIRPFRMCCVKNFTKSFLYYQQESKSLKAQNTFKRKNMGHTSKFRLFSGSGLND